MSPVRKPGRLFLGIAGVLALTVVAAGIALQERATAPSGPPRIGFLSPVWPGPQQKAFTDALYALGYVDGRDILLDFRFAQGKDAALDGLATELVKSGARIIVAQNPSGVAAAKRATGTIPIVFVSLSDPVAMGLVQSLARPGGNITGLANMPADLNLKRLEILDDFLPDLRRVAIVARSGNPNSQLHLADQVATATRLGLAARVYNIADPDQYDATFARAADDGMQAVLLIQDSLFLATRDDLVASAMRHRLPIIADSLDYMKGGVLLAYGIESYLSLYPRAALYVDKILKGAHPAEIPVDQPMDLRLAVNLRVGKELGIPIPRSLLLRANEVIE